MPPYIVNPVSTSSAPQVLGPGDGSFLELIMSLANQATGTGQVAPPSGERPLTPFEAVMKRGTELRNHIYPDLAPKPVEAGVQPDAATGRPMTGYTGQGDGHTPTGNPEYDDPTYGLPEFDTFADFAEAASRDLGKIGGQISKDARSFMTNAHPLGKLMMALTPFGRLMMMLGNRAPQAASVRDKSRPEITEPSVTSTAATANPDTVPTTEPPPPATWPTQWTPQHSAPWRATTADTAEAPTATAAIPPAMPEDMEATSRRTKRCPCK